MDAKEIAVRFLNLSANLNPGKEHAQHLARAYLDQCADLARLRGVLGEVLIEFKSTPCRTCDKTYAEPELRGCVSDHAAARECIAEMEAALAAEGGEG